MSESFEVGIELSVRSIPDPPGVFSAKSCEENKREDLPSDTGHHDVLANVVHRSGVGSGSNGATGRLQQESDEVAADEDDRVSCRSDSGYARGVHDNDA